MPSMIRPEWLDQGDRLYPEQDGKAHPVGVVDHVEPLPGGGALVTLEDGRVFEYAPDHNAYANRRN